MFISHVPNTLQHAAANRITQILSRSFGVDVTEIHGPVHACDAGRWWAGGEDVGAKGGVRRERGEAGDGGLRRHEGLGSDDLGLLCGCLLGFWNVRAAVFAVVDAFVGPIGLGRECVDDLD